MNLPTFDIPPIGPRQGKIWGDTRLVFARNDIEVHFLHVKEGSYCSKHCHDAKWNRFLVITGKLKVMQYPEGSDGPDDFIMLKRSEITDIPPKVWHRFEAVEDVVALEIYWVVLEAGDIVRQDHGGILADTL